jgi:hypothetical protein
MPGARASLGLLLLVPLALAAGGEATEPLAIITASNSQRTEITELALRRIYLGKLTRLDGVRVEPWHLPPGTPARRAFSLAILGQSEEALDRYWLEQALTGGRLPPREVASVEELIAIVSRRAGALGYAPLGAVSGARALRILRVVRGGRALAPTDADYPIRVQVPPAPSGGEGVAR